MFFATGNESLPLSAMLEIFGGGVTLKVYQGKACQRGSAVRSSTLLIDSCIIQLKAQGPSRTCNESSEEEEGLCPELLPSEEGTTKTFS